MPGGRSLHTTGRDRPSCGAESLAFGEHLHESNRIAGQKRPRVQPRRFASQRCDQSLDAIEHAEIKARAYDNNVPEKECVPDDCEPRDQFLEVPDLQAGSDELRPVLLRLRSP